MCHAVDKIVDTWVRYKCAAEVRLCAARAVHVRHTFTVSAHVRSRLEKLRHLASVRLACMYMVQPPRDTTAAQLCIDGDDDVKQSLMILIDCNSAYSGMYDNCRLYDFLRSHRLFDTNLLITLATRWRH